MKKVLYIYVSPLMKNAKGSTCSEALSLFKSEYEKLNPDHESIVLNLNKDEVGNKNLTAENFNEFFNDGLSDKHINLLKSVDKVAIGSPMTNFNYPAVLKNYLDRILVANKTFKYKYDGKGESEGLLKNLKVQLLMSQGASLGWYPFASHVDALVGTWNFAGAKVTKPILIDGTKIPENINKTSKEQIEEHKDLIIEAAKAF